MESTLPSCFSFDLSGIDQGFVPEDQVAVSAGFLPLDAYRAGGAVPFQADHNDVMLLDEGTVYSADDDFIQVRIGRVAQDAPPVVPMDAFIAFLQNAADLL
ncbi:Uncharacterized protein PBTT_09805 [Plasmodiophora brassicae]|uniref:Uncharacterized protein n=1 Tax=Plasmodiophora brassicae TaxID=37360 RepID=A0A0G4J217_PLABS|nr:hypothetical protein PBRA_002005 [Plasmodiophora brassicae]